jgi:predicted nucleotidyltransferase component of viral defense system
MVAPSLTRALINRHGAGRSDTYDSALLDVAQDHLLWLLAELGHFSDGRLVFKGGTSLRKCRLGGVGRFSTDLDFSAPDDDVVLTVREAIDGALVAGFKFSVAATRGDGRHWTLRVEHPELGRPVLNSSVEFARRPLVMEADVLPFIALPIHRAYDIALPRLPVIAEAEACAEKLARYRRTSLGRDVYDLAQMAGRYMDERLVRRLWVLKVWGDVIDDRRGDRPLDAAQVLNVRRNRDFEPESIGKLTQPVDMGGWERRVRERFTFLVDLDSDEIRWATCDPRHRREVEAALATRGFSSD